MNSCACVTLLRPIGRPGRPFAGARLKFDASGGATYIFVADHAVARPTATARRSPEEDRRPSAPLLRHTTGMFLVLCYSRALSVTDSSVFAMLLPSAAASSDPLQHIQSFSSDSTGKKKKGHHAMENGAAVLVPADRPRKAISPRHRGADQQIRQHVYQLFQIFRYRPQGSDRRGDHREPFPYPIHITPIGKDGFSAEGESIVVLGKHLSERGLDFYCQDPLPHRRVIASWECPNGRWLALVLDLRWCRSKRHGWYENGGRFLGIAASPMSSGPETVAGTQMRGAVAS